MDHIFPIQIHFPTVTCVGSVYIVLPIADEQGNEVEAGEGYTIKIGDKESGAIREIR